MNSKVAVIACMDARLDPAKALGLTEGDAHVIRNAGGRAVDALRSVVISQQLLGTREIVIVHHVGDQTGTYILLKKQGPLTLRVIVDELWHAYFLGRGHPDQDPTES